MNVPRNPIKFRCGDRAPPAPRFCQRSGKLWPAFERIAALARLDFDEDAGKFKVFSLCKPAQRVLLCLDAEARATLASMWTPSHSRSAVASLSALSASV
jgi:hypothetical protein